MKNPAVWLAVAFCYVYKFRSYCLSRIFTREELHFFVKKLVYLVVDDVLRNQQGKKGRKENKRNSSGRFECKMMQVHFKFTNATGCDVVISELGFLWVLDGCAHCLQNLQVIELGVSAHDKIMKSGFCG